MFFGCLFSLKVVTNYSTTVAGTKRRFEKGAFPERMMIRPVFGARKARKAEETSTGQLSPEQSTRRGKKRKVVPEYQPDS